MELTAESILKEVAHGYVNDEVSYIDAIVHFAHKHDIEIELIGDIIRRSAVLKSKVREDAERFNLLEERTTQLPL
jgi:hypothetical protein